MDLQNKVAVITGVSKGIGMHLSQQLLSKGAKVYGLGRNNTIQHPNYNFILCDVRNQKEVDIAFDQILADNHSVDILVNNAGLGYFGFLEEMPVEQWHEMFDTNIDGLFFCTRRVLSSMKKQGSGHIINISSTAGLDGLAQTAGYCSTKFAVRGFSEALYKEVRDYGVKVTCVYPGSVKTDFFRNSPVIKPHDNMLMPEELASFMVQALETSSHFHQVNLEVRPLMPKGRKSWEG
ncbi:MAG: SDR family oxidoreductase [Bacteroidia bacterium]|jgi:short-subunit dehydrogenase|nr:SDR family oxidoreductase [Bacteroidia bacterium]MCO5255101.1 SDR family oxidoreductase [Bacteroidota bacterium]MCZ2129583.1 SDR family oxidoreductase [Bacteroidia bacterium]